MYALDEFEQFLHYKHNKENLFFITIRILYFKIQHSIHTAFVIFFLMRIKHLKENS